LEQAKQVMLELLELLLVASALQVGVEVFLVIAVTTTQYKMLL
jgi:hypothetical protein